ncbi:hypothetical protein DFH28DRAFT_1082291 [Melampsora americana]|nr:hypothetical protein DFH28DRAFT_1082291 [Melampsora americana]
MKRDRPEISSLETEVASLKDEIATFKALLQEAEHRIALQIEDLVEKIEHQTTQVKLLYPVVEYHTKEIAVTQARVQDSEVEILDIQTEATREYQHTRALEMAIQKLADTSPAQPRVDVHDEIENFSDKRYDYYLASRKSAHIVHEGPVSDPRLGS